MHRVGRQGPQPFQQTGARDGADAATDGDTCGVHTFGGRDVWSQWGSRARARHRNDNNEFIVDPGEDVIDGDDDGGSMFARFASASGAESHQP